VEKPSKSVLRLVAEPLLLAVVLAFAVRATARIYSIPSSSMAPTLTAGDHILVTRYRGEEPARGDVVVFHSLQGRELAVKRVVGIPGDLIQTRSGKIVLGGHTLSEPYLAMRAHSGVIAPQLVPAGHLFVLGDHREDSFDSRHWGPLPASRVVGRARMVLWSSGMSETAMADKAHATSVSNDDPRATSLRGRRVFKWIE
jgi:signal peptidase I